MSSRYSFESPFDGQPSTMSSAPVSSVASQSKKRPSTSMASTPPGDRKSSSVFTSNGPVTPSSGALTPRKSKFDSLLSTKSSQTSSFQKDSIKQVSDPKSEVDSFISSPAPIQSLPKRTKHANTPDHFNINQSIVVDTDDTTSTGKSGIPEPDFATPAPRMRKPLRQAPMSVDTLSSPLALSSLRLTTHTHNAAATATNTLTSTRDGDANDNGIDEGNDTRTPQQQRSMSTTSSASQLSSPASTMVVDKDGFATPALPRSHAFFSGEKSGKKPVIHNNAVSGMDSSLLFSFSSLPPGSITATPVPTHPTNSAAVGRTGLNAATPGAGTGTGAGAGAGGAGGVEGVGTTSTHAQRRTPGNPYRNMYTGTGTGMGTARGMGMGMGTPGGVMTPRVFRETGAGTVTTPRTLRSGADAVVTPRILHGGGADAMSDVVTPRIGQVSVVPSHRRRASTSTNTNTSGSGSGSGSGRKRAIAAVAMPSTPAPSFLPYGSPTAPKHAVNLSIDTGADTDHTRTITGKGMSPNPDGSTTTGTGTGTGTGMGMGMGMSGDWAASSVSLSDTTSQLYRPQSSLPTLPAMASMALYNQLPMSGASPIAVAHNALQLLKTLGNGGQSLGSDVQTPRSGWTPRNGVFTPHSNHPQTPRTPMHVRGLFRPYGGFPFSGFSGNSGIVGVPLPLPSPGMPFTPMSQQSFFLHNDGLKSPASTQMLEEYGISEKPMDERPMNTEEMSTIAAVDTRNENGDLDRDEDQDEDGDEEEEEDVIMEADAEMGGRKGRGREGEEEDDVEVEMMREDNEEEVERERDGEDWFSVDMMRRAGMDGEGEEEEEEEAEGDGEREEEAKGERKGEGEGEGEESVEAEHEQEQEPVEMTEAEVEGEGEIEGERREEEESLEIEEEGVEVEEEGVEVEAVVVAASPRTAVEDMSSVRARYDAMVAAAVKTFEGEAEAEADAEGEEEREEGMEDAGTAGQGDNALVNGINEKDGIRVDERDDSDMPLTSTTAALLSMPLFGAYDIDTSLLQTSHAHAYTHTLTPAHNTSRSVLTPHSLNSSIMDASFTTSTLSTPYNAPYAAPYAASGLNRSGLNRSLFDTPIHGDVDRDVDVGVGMGMGVGVLDVNAVTPRKHGGLFSPARAIRGSGEGVGEGSEEGDDVSSSNSNTNLTSNSTAAEHNTNTTSTSTSISTSASALTSSLFTPSTTTTLTTPYTGFKPLSFDVRLSVAESIVSRLLLSTQQSIAIQNQLTIPLSTSDIARADAIIHNTPLRTVLFASNTAEVTGEKIKALSGQGWLNDDIVNGYMSLLLERARWSKSQKVNINSLDRLIIPCHINGNHWTLCMADLQRKQIEYYDSLRGEQPHMMESLLKYIIDEAKQYDNKDISGEATLWRIVYPKDIPTQRNGYDCGVFVCANANILSRGGRISLHDVDSPVIGKNTNKIPKNPDFGMGRDRHGTRFALDSNANGIEEGDSLLKGLYSLSLGKKKVEAKKMDLPFTGEDMANFRRRIALDIANKKVI